MAPFIDITAWPLWNQDQGPIKPVTLSTVSFIVSSPDMEIPEDVKTFTTYKAAVILEYYTLPIICVFGLAGNILSLIVVTQKSKRRLQFYVYLAALAIADSNILICVIIFWAAMIAGVKNLDWLCQVTGYIAQVGAGVSSWIVVVVTIDRFKAIHNPLRYRNHRRPMVAVKVSAGITFTCIVLSVPHLFAAEVIEDIGCANLNNSSSFVKVYAFVSVFIFSLIPFVITFTMNLRITVTLKGRGNSYSTNSVLKGKVLQWRPFATTKRVGISSGRHSRDHACKEEPDLMSVTQRVPSAVEEQAQDQLTVPKMDVTSFIYSISNNVEPWDLSARQIPKEEDLKTYTNIQMHTQENMQVTSETNDEDFSAKAKEDNNLNPNEITIYAEVVRGREIGQSEDNLFDHFSEVADQDHSSMATPVSVSSTRQHLAPGETHEADNDLLQIQIAIPMASSPSSATPHAACQSQTDKPRSTKRPSTSESQSAGPRSNTRDSGENKALERQLAVMLLGVSVAFLVLTLPQYVRYFMFALVDLEEDKSSTIADFLLLYVITNKLYLINSAINFYIYALTGSTFRNDLKFMTKNYCFCSCQTNSNT